LVGSLPLAYAVGVATIAPGAALAHLSLPLDSRQVAEVWLTAAQSLFGVAVLASLSLELGEALILAGVFLSQLVLGSVLRVPLQDPSAADETLTIFTLIYLVLSAVFAIRARRVIGFLLRRRRYRRDRIKRESEDRVRTLTGGS
jgi:cation:H+ antiporter